MERGDSRESAFRLMVAPLQGLTEAAWRSAHFRMLGEQQGEVEYFTPFIRVEKGEVRARDLRDFTSELNAGMKVTPQIIFRDEEEWRLLVGTLAAVGAQRVDMNLGCPFPPQVRKGRGAGVLAHPDVMERIAVAMEEYAGTMEFSVKMRLGISDPAQALSLVDILNGMPLRHVTVHPRTAVMQYSGSLLLDEMERFVPRLRAPVIFNGGVCAPAEIRALQPTYAGVMVGRGLLSRPTLFAEFISGSERTPRQQAAAFVDILSSVSSILQAQLSGPAHFKNKLKGYWDYAHPTLDRKIVKQSRKSGLPPCHKLHI